MIILMVGPPGSGKTTHARLLVERDNFVRISVGDLIRDNINQFKKGEKAKVDNGRLVDFQTVNKLVDRRLQLIGADSNIVIDGYPRQIETAQWLVSKYGRHIGCSLQLDLSDQELHRRLKKRGRVDDDIKTVLVRFEVFCQNQPEIVKFFKDRNIPTFVIGTGRVREDAYKQVKEKISLVETGISFNKFR